MRKRVICIGSVLIDELFVSKQPILSGTSNPASVTRSAGGVISNIARHLGLLGVEVELITALGEDTDAIFLNTVLSGDHVGMSHIYQTKLPTGRYVALLSPDGSLFTAVVTDTIEQVVTPDSLSSIAPFLSTASIIVADCNLSVQSLQWLIDYCKTHQLKLIIEPVSVPKARKLTELDLQGVFLITPNTDELLVMVDDGITEETACMKSLVTAGVQQVWLRKGAEGSVFYNEQLKDFHLPAASLTVTDATGAGDAALAAWIKFYLDGHDNEKCVKAGHALAYEVLQQVGSVLKNLTDQKLISSIKKYYNDVI